MESRNQVEHDRKEVNAKKFWVSGKLRKNIDKILSNNLVKNLNHPVIFCLAF